MTRVAIYTRISRDDGGVGAGVARQKQDCLDLCQSRGWLVAEVITDNDVSAYSGRHRPGYTRLMELMEEGLVDVVLAYAPERLHRSIRELDDFIKVVQKRSIHVETLKAGAWDVSTSHGQMIAQMLGVISQAESARTGERVRRAHQQTISDGRWVGAIPFGMRRTSSPGLPEVDPERSPIVQDVFARVARGESLTSIAVKLNQAGVRPQRGDSWTHTSVRRLVQSPALGSLTKVNGELIKAKFTGPIPESEWRAAQAMLSNRPSGERRQSHETITLLGGILHCSEHDVPLFGATKSTRMLYQAQSPGKCATSIPQWAVDGLVSELVVARLRQHDAVEVLTPPSMKPEGLDRAEVLRQHRRDLAELVADGLIARTDAEPKLEKIRHELESIERAFLPVAATGRDLLDPQATWEEWSTVQRREVIRILFASISVCHGTQMGAMVDLGRITPTWAES